MSPRLLPALAISLALALLTGCTSNADPRNPPAAAAPAASTPNAPTGTGSAPSFVLPPPAAPSAAPGGATASPAAAAQPQAVSTPSAPAAVASPTPAPSTATPTITPSATATGAASPTPAASPAPAASPSPAASASPVATPTPAEAQVTVLPPVSQGFRIRIPAVGIDAPIVNVGLEPDGSMAAPDGPDIVGWYSPGTRPGQRGNALLDGHVDWTDRVTGVARTAVFYPLKDLQVGQDIVIDADGRRHSYRVRESLVFAWDDPSALRVLQPTSEAIVTLITCEGAFDRGARNYSHRRVIIAALTGSE